MGSETVISGGDDCRCKIWDLRQLDMTAYPKPTHVVGEEEFDAGVTSVAFHPFLDHVFATGSYDESLRIWDIRFLQQPIHKTQSCGGGIWRLKWHPHEKTKLLVAAMHGGCQILNV